MCNSVIHGKVYRLKGSCKMAACSEEAVFLGANLLAEMYGYTVKLNPNDW